MGKEKGSMTKSIKREEGGRKRNSSGSLTHFSIPPTRLVPPHCLCVRPRRRPGVEEWRVFKRLQESYEDQQRCHVFGCLQKLPCNNITLPHIKSDVRNHFVCVDKSVYEAHYKVELGEPDLNLKTIRNDFHWLKLFGYNRPLQFKFSTVYSLHLQ